MDRKWLLISFIMITFLFSGCAGFEKERAALLSANNDLKKELVKQEESLKYHQKLVVEQKAEIAELEEENAALTNKMKELEKREAAEKTAEIKKPAQAQAEAEEAGVKPLRIKVLAGVSQMPKAKGISKKLTGLKYRIERLDRVPKPFTRTTVFYGAESKKEAAAIAKQVGAKAVKPISWNSEFDIVISVGKEK